MSEEKTSAQPGSGKNSGSRSEQDTEIRVVDRRHFADPGSVRTDTPAEEKPRYPSYVEELLAKLSESERRFEEKRRKVDEEISRMRSRLEADFERKVDLNQRELLVHFLEVLDNLERAIEAASSDSGKASLLEGVQMTADLFRSRLLSRGVEVIEMAGKPFDPNLGQAVGVVAVEDSSLDGIVMEQVLKGYRMGDLLLRPAQVRVGKCVQP